MSTSDVRSILDEIGELRREFREDLGEVKRQVTATNGSVRELKEWRAKIEGAMWLIGRIPVVAAIAASIAAVVAVTHG